MASVACSINIFTCGNCRVTLVTSTVINREYGKNGECLRQVEHIRRNNDDFK
jgi:hypothetical protein